MFDEPSLVLLLGMIRLSLSLEASSAKKRCVSWCVFDKKIYQVNQMTSNFKAKK